MGHPLQSALDRLWALRQPIQCNDRTSNREPVPIHNRLPSGPVAANLMLQSHFQSWTRYKHHWTACWACGGLTKKSNWHQGPKLASGTKVLDGRQGLRHFNVAVN